MQILHTILMSVERFDKSQPGRYCCSLVLKRGGFKRAWGVCGKPAQIHVTEGEVIRAGWYCQRHGTVPNLGEH